MTNELSIEPGRSQVREAVIFHTVNVPDTESHTSGIRTGRRSRTIGIALAFCALFVLLGVPQRFRQAVTARFLGLISRSTRTPSIRREPIHVDPALGPGRYAVNLWMNTDYACDGAWVDASKSLRRWGHPARPWQEAPTLKLSKEGYPLSDAGALSFLRGYPDGRYQLTFEGTGRVNVGGKGSLVSPITTSGIVHSGIVLIKHKGQDLFTIALTDLDPRDPIRNLRLIRPGYSASTTQVFAEHFLRRLRPFTTVRPMEWTCVNRTEEREWSQRVQPDSFLRTGAQGVAYEDLIALANESHKDLWLTIPESATDDYMASLGKLLVRGLDHKQRVYLELGNELWNGTFPQSKRIILMAKNDPELTRKDEYGRAAEKAAKRTSEAAVIFRREFATESSRVVPVLCGHSANTYFLTCGLEYLAKQPGGAKACIAAVAIAPFLTLRQEVDKPGLTRDALFQDLDDSLRGNLCQWITQNVELASKYELPLIAYEGGQHLVDWSSSHQAEVNGSLKREAQNDPRMAELYLRLNREWTARGGGLFSYYALTSSYGKSGYWGLLADQSEPGSQKWDAVLSVALPPGDTTLDGRVDMADFQVLARHFGQSRSWREQGDLNRDGIVNVADLTIFRENANGLAQADRDRVREFALKVARP
jgi:hypothetical protein